MGSWDASCGLTYTPICPGERAVVQLMVKNPAYSENEAMLGGSCYPNEYYKPFLTPLHGQYIDYGCFLIDEEEPLNLLRQWTKDPTLTQIEDETMKGHVLSFGARKFSRINWCAYHEEPYRLAVESQHMVDSDFAKIKSYLETHSADCQERSVMRKSILHVSGLAAWTRELVKLDLLNDWLMEDLSRLDYLKEGCKFLRFMNLTRRYYHPPSGCGSQEWNFELHKLIAEWTVEHSRIEEDYSDLEE